MGTREGRDPSARRYDRAYFEKWYRTRRYRVKAPTELRRQVAFVAAAAEYILGRPLRSALDVGAGEGQWRAELRRLRPRLRYVGVDPSEYVVRTFGARRNIVAGSFGTLDRVGLRGPFDLVVSCGVINYLSPRELRAGLAQLYELSAGVVYLEIFTRADEVIGDIRPSQMRSPSWYLRLIRDARFVPCGLHCYVPDWLKGYTAALERGR